MRELLLLLLFSTLVVSSFAQIKLPILDKLKSIKLLTSTSEDVEKLLVADSFDYSSSSEFYRQTFYMEDSVVTAWYARGTCDQKELEWNDWNVPKWSVTNVSVMPKQDYLLKDVSIDISKFRRERTDWHRKGFFIYFDKSSGRAIGVEHNRIVGIYFFPSRGEHSKLCDDKAVRSYYASSRWIRPPLEVSESDWKKAIIDYNDPANVRDVRITQLKTSVNQFEIETIAEDPENDVLTYVYKVSAGKIVGSGARVVWDLSDVSPGSYTLGVGADDGCGICGEIVTKSVTIK